MRRLVLLAPLLLVAFLVAPAQASAVQTESVSTRGNTYRTLRRLQHAAGRTALAQVPAEGHEGCVLQEPGCPRHLQGLRQVPEPQQALRITPGRPEGDLRVNSITSHMVGEHTVTWFVAGDKVGTYRFRIHA